MARPRRAEAPLPRWSELLRTLREASGVTQDGWAAHLGYSRATVQRWERGTSAPDAAAERALLGLCREKRLLRGYQHGPLAGVTVTEDLLRDALAEGRAGSVPGASTVHEPEGKRGQGAPSPPAAAARGNLPVPATSFIGREGERATVSRLLDRSRLVTLTGAGGVGKTRLALETMAGRLDRYSGGVWLVELAGLADPALIAQAAAAVLGVREAPNLPIMDSLVEALRERECLLLLDNCEHLRAGAADFVEAVQRRCPAVGVLATSREALGIVGETVWWVPSLPTPQATTDNPPRHTAASVRGVPAAQLFCARAEAVHPAFALSDENAPAVAAICRRLDGIPLALELAAARARIFTPAQIAARLDARFRLLTRGSPAAPGRHQTLRAALDWSYDLLPESEQRLLQRLSVFPGGCDIEAAEAVCAGEGIDADELPDLLHDLIEKSLVTVAYHGEAARYRLLETVREYGREQLTTVGAAAAVQRRQLGWALDFAERAAGHLEGSGQAILLNQLEEEQDNLRAALRWSLDHELADLGLGIAARLPLFWQWRGRLSEGRDWLDQLIARGGAAAPATRARALLGAGMLAEQQGAFAAAAAYLADGLELARAIEDLPLIASALRRRGSVTWRRGDLAAARAAFEESLVIARQLERPALISYCLNSLGVVATDQGDLAMAEDYLREALALARSLSDMATVAVRLNNLAMVAIRLGDLVLARGYAEEALAIHRAHGHIGYLPNDLRRLAEIVIEQGEPDAARAYAAEALEVAREVGNQFEIAEALDELARIAFHQGDLAAVREHAHACLAAAHAIGSQRQIWRSLDRLGQVARRQGDLNQTIRLFAAANSVREATGEALAEDAARDLDAFLAEARAALGEGAVATAWRDGSSLSQAEVISASR